MPSVFLCHASEDKPIAEPIQLALANAGYDVFYDESTLRAGGDYQDSIHRAIQKCDLFVFLISKDSLSQGKYTLSELRFAREKWPSPVNRVLAVNVGVIPVQNIPNYLTSATILSVSGNAAAEVRTAVRALLKEQRRTKLRWLFVFSIAVTFAVALIVLFVEPPEPPTPNLSLPPPPMRGEILLQSEPGDYIGNGKTYEFTNANGKLTATATPNSVTIYFEGDDHWSLDFAAPEGKRLEPGQYESAQRAAFHNPVKPGIDISGAGRGCNTLTGHFTIQEIEFSSTGTLSRFSAEFEQHCEDAIPGLHGSLDLVAD